MTAVRVGIVGTGSVASSVHLPILTRRTDLFKIVALADLNIPAAHALAKRFGIAENENISLGGELLD